MKMNETPASTRVYLSKRREKKHNGGPGLRPLVWKSGPDPRRHDQYRTWLQAQAQATYRGEGWDLTFDQYVELWDPYWHQRGRDGDSYSMSRLDRTLPWSRDNCYMATRAELNRRQAQTRRPKRTRAEIEKDNKR
jgi:hypothetical protein